MELVIDHIALHNGFIDEKLYAILVLMAIVTTLVTPMLLKQAFERDMPSIQLKRTTRRVGHDSPVPTA